MIMKSIELQLICSNNILTIIHTCPSYSPFHFSVFVHCVQFFHSSLLFHLSLKHDFCVLFSTISQTFHLSTYSIHVSYSNHYPQ